MKTIYEYCAEQMMTTQLAKDMNWSYEMVLARFKEKYPIETEFRQEMRRTEVHITALTGMSYSWVDDYDKQVRS
jgi:hypothetical protein